MNEERKSPKRLTLDIPEEMHQDIKIAAIKRNITIRKWVMRAVYIALMKEKSLTREE